MSAIVAPEFLQRVLAGDIKRSFQDTFTKDRGEVGAPRLRNRSTRRLARFEYGLPLDNSELVDLDTFIEDTLSNGVLPFRWTDPRDNVSYNVQLDASPDDSHVGGTLNNVRVVLNEI